MHVRVTRTARGSKSYRSVQLAQTYRNESGKPATRVIASLGNLPDVEVDNLRVAIAASRKGQAVVVAEQRSVLPKIKRSLAYLDVATCWRVWQEWGLTALVDALSPNEPEVSVGQMVAALSVQRCVAPASKLEASRWYPTTSLPELQGVRPAQFNNTRVHRALEALAAMEEPLQERLAEHIEADQGQFVNLFLDCTDTWFVGQGPSLAASGLTKEGLFRRKVGIALLCDQRGFPLRWATVEGNHSEVHTMLDMIEKASSLSWASQLPIVVDRAMGRGVTIEGLLARDVRFVTAVPAQEIVNYSTRIPLGMCDDVALGEADRCDKKALQQLHGVAKAAGFQKVGDRYLLDLGVIAKGDGGEEVPASWLTPSRAVAVVTAAKTVRRELEGGCTRSELAERYNCTENTLRRWEAVLKLNEELQRRVLDGAADHVRPPELCRVAELPAGQQASAFAKLCASDSQQPPLRANQQLRRFFQVPSQRVRAVVLFSPARFIEQRQAALRAAKRIEELTVTLNASLKASRRTKSTQSLGRLEVALRKESLSDVFDVSIVETDQDERRVPQLVVTRKHEAWTRRRRTDGFTLIVSHPDVLRAPDALVALYFAKDLVEKDFQSIKSVLALRPVHHQTASKVRAHVTLCMLALVLQRTIERKLHEAGLALSCSAALTLLETGRLNLFAGRARVYSVTEPDPDQRRILTALKLTSLGDDASLRETLQPR
jgi:hypothetical protein